MADHNPSGDDASSNTNGEEPGLGEKDDGVVPHLRRPIPDSLHTLSEFMSRMEMALSQHMGQSPNDTANLPRTELPSNRCGVPTPDALGIVMRQAQRLISGPTVEALSRIAGRLEEEAGSSDASIRDRLETESVEVGHAMQHLGALFLELGRTIMTLRMGQSPAESSVNAGPAVYVSASGPNPIMVQPCPLQTRSLFSDSGVNTNEGAGSGFGHYVDAHDRSSNVPLGLGLGGLQSKRGCQHDEVANALSQALQNPALSGLLASFSQQTGIGSLNVMGKLTQNPEIRNTVNQIAQKTDARDIVRMGSVRGGSEVGGSDLSRMIQKTTPVASQTLNSSSMGAASTSSMRAAARLESISMRKVQSFDMYSLLDPQELAQRIVRQSSPRGMFSVMVRNNVAELYKHGDGQYSLLNELCSEDGLARGFLEMLRHDISRRLQEESEPP